MMVLVFNIVICLTAQTDFVKEEAKETPAAQKVF